MRTGPELKHRVPKEMYWKSPVACLVLCSGILYGADLEPGALPNSRLTPGATLPVGVRDLCAVGYTKMVRRVPTAVRIQVYTRYQRSPESGKCCEIDHLIPLELGGSNDINNLWPQRYDLEWNAHVKDSLETLLHKRVCSGNMSLREAQMAIAKNWIEAYKQYRSTTPHKRRNTNAPFY